MSFGASTAEPTTVEESREEHRGPPRRPPSLIRNVVTNWGAFVFAAVTNFVLSPFIVRSLGTTAYGAFVLANSLVGYLGLLDLGVRGAVTRYIARFHSSGQHEDASQLTSAALKIFGLAAIAAVVLSVGLAAVVDRVFQVPPGVTTAIRIVAIVGGVNIAVALIDGVLGGVIIGLQRFDYTNGIEVAIGAVRALAVVTALNYGKGIVALALLQLGSSVARLAIDYAACRRLYPQLRLRFGGDKQYMKVVLSFGLASSVLHIAGQIMLFGDSAVIGIFLPVGMVTYFAIAGNLTDYGRQVAGGVSRVLTPLVSAVEARGENAAIIRSLLVGARSATLLVLPVAVTFIIRGTTFIRLWMGAEYATLSGQVLAVLAVFLAVHAAYEVMTASMMGINRHRGLIPIFLADAVCNVVLSILLVPRFGVVGSALGTVIPQLVVTLLIGPWYVRRELGVPLTSFWMNSHVRPLLAIVPFALVSYYVEHFWPSPNLAVYFAQIALTLPFAALGGWVVGLTPAERRAMSAFFARRALAAP